MYELMASNGLFMEIFPPKEKVSLSRRLFIQVAVGNAVSSTRKDTTWLATGSIVMVNGSPGNDGSWQPATNSSKSRPFTYQIYFLYSLLDCLSKPVPILTTFCRQEPGAGATSSEGLLQPGAGPSSSGELLQPCARASSSGGLLQPVVGLCSSEGLLQPGAGATSSEGLLQPGAGPSSAGGLLQPCAGASSSGGLLQPVAGPCSSGGLLQPVGSPSSSGGLLHPVLRRHYAPEADVWSADTILYMLLHGVPPSWAGNRLGAHALLRDQLAKRWDSGGFKRMKWKMTEAA
ncbi:unnamed protein product [Dovyalis caffra]|uniref:Uncharacterized protein n=1 Tax=Dovyalis caffra TaxID=77055 RepID=A0AAV1RVL8_9ROSI|nr:unnamed protein product [Dovyalis caffra]